VSLSIRLRPEPYRLMVEAAKNAGLSMNEWIEKMIVEVTRKNR
jgi:predicted HicB family RNase H-like nuclease